MPLLLPPGLLGSSFAQDLNSRGPPSTISSQSLLRVHPDKCPRQSHSICLSALRARRWIWQHFSGDEDLIGTGRVTGRAGNAGEADDFAAGDANRRLAQDGDVAARALVGSIGKSGGLFGTAGVASRRCCGPIGCAAFGPGESLRA